MKLVIGGSSGYVGAELVRQALANPAITSVIGLSRRETPAPPDAGPSAAKLKSVVCDNFESYSDAVKKELEDSDACIWTIAVTRSKAKELPFEETAKISRDYALTALETISSLRSKKDGTPFRYVYISGHFAPRSREEVPETLKNFDIVDYGLVRGEAEVKTLAFGEKSNGTVECATAKPGVIDSPGKETRNVPGLPHVERTHVAASLLDQVLNGFEKDTLSNDDMTRIGKKVLGEE